jgi:hypothetical protein
MPGVKMMEKATLLAQKKNFEGNTIMSKNSFAVLSNDELVIRSKKWELMFLMLTSKNLT